MSPVPNAALPPSASAQAAVAEPAPAAEPVNVPVSAPERSVAVKKAAAQREVQLGVIVRRLFNVDTLAQVFGAQMTIVMMWECPDNEEPDEDDDGDWTPNWTPKYRVRRVMEEIRHEEQFVCEVVNGKRMVKMEAEWVVNIQQRLDLHSFPVDCQELKIEVMSVLPTSAYKFVPLKSTNGDGKHQLVRLLTEECVMNDFRLLQERPFTFDLFSAKMLLKTCSNLTIKMQVQRKSHYYMLNVAVIMLLICSFSFCAWACHPADVGSRHGVDFNLILTAIAFKLVLSTMLPPVSYSTLLDFYVMGCFMFLAYVTVAHTVVPMMFYGHEDNSPLTQPPWSSDDEMDLIDIDRLILYISAAAWIGFNVIYFAFYRYRRMIEYNKMVSRAKREQQSNSDSFDEVKDMTTGMVVHSHELNIASTKKVGSTAVLATDPVEI